MDFSEEHSGTFYVGRSTLRHESEPKTSDYENMDDFTGANPELRPHVFIDYTFDVASLLMSPSSIFKGSSGIIVKYQKLIRENSSIHEVNAWRESFDTDMIPWSDVIDLSNVTDFGDMVKDGILTYDEPFVILDGNDPSLDVPMQTEDMREELLNVAHVFGGDPEHIKSMSEDEVRSAYNEMWD